MKAAFACVALLALPAAADEGAYHFIFGPGLAVRSLDAPVAPQVSVLAQSTYGLTDRFNWELPLWFDFTSGHLDLSLGLGLELVFLKKGRLQCNVGAGALAAFPLLPRRFVELGPYVEAAARWKIIWGLGVGLELHAGWRWAVEGGQSDAFGAAVLAANSEL